MARADVRDLQQGHPVRLRFWICRTPFGVTILFMNHELTKAQKRALRAAVELAHQRDRSMDAEDRDVHYLEARTSDLPIVGGGAVAQGIIRIEEVGEAARELVARVADSLRAISEESSDDAGGEEPDPHDPSAALSVGAIVAEFELLTEETTLFVNRRTGEVAVISNEDLPDEEPGDETEDENEPEWLAEEEAEARDIAGNPDWIALLGRHDLDELGIMKRFARRARPAASRDLFDALSGRGAFRRFREVIRARALEKEWDTWRTESLGESVRFELQQRKIPFRR